MNQLNIDALVPLTIDDINSNTDCVMFYYSLVDRKYKDTVDLIIQLYKDCTTFKYYGIKTTKDLLAINIMFFNFLVREGCYDNSQPDVYIDEKFFNILKRCFWIILKFNSMYFDLKDKDSSYLIIDDQKPIDSWTQWSHSSKEKKFLKISECLTRNEISDRQLDILKEVFFRINNVEQNTYILEFIHRTFAPLYYTNEVKFFDNQNAFHCFVSVLLVCFNFNVKFKQDSLLFKSFRIYFWEVMNLVARNFEFFDEDVKNPPPLREEVSKEKIGDNHIPDYIEEKKEEKSKKTEKEIKKPKLAKPKLTKTNEKNKDE